MFRKSKLLLDEELVVPKIKSNREYFTLQQMRQQWWNVDSHSSLAQLVCCKLIKISYCKLHFVVIFQMEHTSHDYEFTEQRKKIRVGQRGV